MKKNKVYEVIFLNQVTGPLFRQLAEDVSQAMGSCLLFTGQDALYQPPNNQNLQVAFGPCYNRSHFFRRLWTWTHYLIVAVWKVFSLNNTAMLMIVSNPPMLGAVGYLAWLFRRQKYIVLIYDLYPGLLINMGKIKKRGLIAKIWQTFNRAVWSHAELIVTIGDEMAKNIARELELCLTNPSIVVVPNWADGDVIQPLKKIDNIFVKQHNLLHKFTIMYSGNVGATHNLLPLINTAKMLKKETNVCFLLIGGGVKWSLLEQEAKNLENVILLPFQPESLLPLTLTTGDIAVVTIEAGAEGYCVPSKTYYALAAGRALLVLSKNRNELTELVEENQCGMWVSNEQELLAAIQRFRKDEVFLHDCQLNARAAFENKFSRKNTQSYIHYLKQIKSSGAL